MSTPNIIDDALVAAVDRAVREAKGVTQQQPMPIPYALWPHSQQGELSAADVRRIVREELDRDRLERSVLADYGRLTAEWDRQHGVRR